MPCHHRWSQCEQLYILIGSPLTVISITTSSRERQVGHFTLVISTPSAVPLRAG